MKVIHGVQGDDIWWEVKRTVPSASRFDEIIQPVKGELSKSADNYIAELVAEHFVYGPGYFTTTGHPVNTFAIQQGKDTEPEARRWVAMDSGLEVAEVRFCLSDDLSIGCSPDGLIGLTWEPEAEGKHNGEDYYAAKTEGVLELKVPLLKTHSAYLAKGILPPDYKPQCHGHLIVTGATYCEFVSYSKFMPPLRVRVVRDSYTDKVEAALKTFVEQYAEALAKVRRK